jgi:S-DNA-T family DNA segregation ATPase FtsK/SpoIIIE
LKVNKAVNKRTQRNARQAPSSTSSARVNAAKDKARRFGLRLQGSVREGVVVLLLALCVFLLLALLSYHPSDPGWSYQGPETEVRNWMGQVGAWWRMSSIHCWVPVRCGGRVCLVLPPGG